MLFAVCSLQFVVWLQFAVFSLHQYLLFVVDWLQLPADKWRRVSGVLQNHQPPIGHQPLKTDNRPTSRSCNDPPTHRFTDPITIDQQPFDSSILL